MADEYVKHAREHLLARYTVNGVNASDFMDVTHSIERWDDWCKAWSARAAIHEELGRAALAGHKYVSAAEHLCRARTLENLRGQTTKDFFDYIRTDHDFLVFGAPVRRRAAAKKSTLGRFLEG